MSHEGCIIRKAHITERSPQGCDDVSEPDCGGCGHSGRRPSLRTGSQGPQSMLLS